MSDGNESCSTNGCGINTGSGCVVTSEDSPHRNATEVLFKEARNAGLTSGFNVSLCNTVDLIFVWDMAVVDQYKGLDQDQRIQTQHEKINAFLANKADVVYITDTSQLLNIAPYDRRANQMSTGSIIGAMHIGALEQ